MSDFKVGDEVVCRCPGSGVDALPGRITHLDVTASDGVERHVVSFTAKDGYTVLPPENLERAGK